MKNKRTNKRQNEKGKLERTPKNEVDMYVCVLCVDDEKAELKFG